MGKTTPKEALKEAKTPIPWGSLTIGNWYQCRFEFTEAKTEPATRGRIPGNPTPNMAPNASPPPSDKVKNKSHRVFLIGKQGTQVKHAICLYLTSFGGGVKTPAEFVADERYLKFIPINDTPMPLQTPFYANIEVSAKSLHGFLNYVDKQHLPGDGVGVQNRRRIINMPESLDTEKRIIPVSSPEWVLQYLRKLMAEWEDKIMWGGSIEKMAGACEAITKIYTPMRARIEEEGENLSRPNQLATTRDDRTTQPSASGQRKRTRITPADPAPPSYEGGYGFGFGGCVYDSGVHDMGWVPPMSPCQSTHTSEDSDDPEDEEPLYIPAQLVSIGFYEIGDGDEVDEEVDFSLLGELFGIRPVEP